MGMLVLSRKVGEEIIIGNGIKIMVVEVRGDKVRIGIDAPRDVSVHRKEVLEAIAAETRKPAEPSLDSDHPDFGKDYA